MKELGPLCVVDFTGLGLVRYGSIVCSALETKLPYPNVHI